MRDLVKIECCFIRGWIIGVLTVYIAIRLWCSHLGILILVVLLDTDLCVGCGQMVCYLHFREMILDVFGVLCIMVYVTSIWIIMGIIGRMLDLGWNARNNIILSYSMILRLSGNIFVIYSICWLCVQIPNIMPCCVSWLEKHGVLVGFQVTHCYYIVYDNWHFVIRTNTYGVCNISQIIWMWAL